MLPIRFTKEPLCAVRTGRKLYAAALVVTMMWSCSAPGSGAAGPVHAVATAEPLGVRLPDSAGYMYSLAWLGDGTLVVGSGPNATPSIEQVWQLRQDGSEVRQLPTPPGSDCLLTSRYMFPTALADGRLGLTRTCDSANVAVDTVVAYDLKSRAFTTLADLGGAMHVGAVSWNPDLTRGIGAQSSRTCSDVAWVASNGPQGIAVEISEGGKAWRLDEWLRRPAGASCTNEGRADCPAWSPDGRQIALLASPKSVGVEGQGRLDAPWDIYLIDVGSLRPTSVLSNLGDPCDLAWSPDGRWLVFTGSVGNQRGVWLFSPSTRKLHLVASRGYESRHPVWSPDGKKLAVIETLSPLGQWPPRTRLAIADVRATTAA